MNRPSPSVHALLSAALAFSAISSLAAPKPSNILFIFSDDHAYLRPVPAGPGSPFVWSQQPPVRVGDDGKVPGGAQRQSVNAPPPAL